MLRKLRLFFFTTRFRITVWYTSLFLLLEILFGLSIYIYLNKISHHNLDSTLKKQASSILRLVEEKHFDLDTFKPSEVYKTEDELLWDILYNAIVFNARNTFIQISSPKKVLFKTANMGKLSFATKPNLKEEITYDDNYPSLSEGEIRFCQIKSNRFYIIVAYPKENIEQMLNNLTDIYLFTAPLFLIIAAIGGIIISSRSLARIDQIIQKTEEITAENLSDVIPGGELNDEYGRLINKMNEMIRRIKTSVEYMNQFSISAAHELKTPLTILRGEIEVALRSSKTPEYYVEVLKSNYDETIRMIKIIENLFFISKSDSALIKINYREVDLHKFLSGIIRNYEPICAEKSMKIILEEPEQISAVFDDQLMKQALINLIDNAVKYGNAESEITIAYTLQNSTLTISVENIGEPIKEEEKESIFNRFYRISNPSTEKVGGVGLGLSVVKSILSLHGGTIMVASTNNTNKFSINIPQLSSQL